MIKGADASDSVAVVGAGIIGLSIAWHLTKRGFKVVLYDPEMPGSGCSSGNAGAISPGSVTPLAMPGLLAKVPGMLLNPNSALHIPLGYWISAFPWFMRFAASARPGRVAVIAKALADLYGDAVSQHIHLLSEVGAADVVRKTGQLHLYRNEHQLRGSRSDWKLRAAHGAKFEKLDRAAIEALEPQIGPAYRIGIFLPDAAMSVNPQRQANAIADALKENGVGFRRERVFSFVTEGARICGVTTNVRTYRHSRVVLSAGAWSARLLVPLGYDVPLEAQRGYHLDFADSTISLSRPIVPADRKVFITSMETGLRVAGTVEIAGLEAPAKEARAKLLINDLKAVLPAAQVAQPKPFWMGRRPCLPDSLPVIGRLRRWDGLICAFGHGHLGLTASAVTGSIVGCLVAGEETRRDLGPFSVERF
jgi:D-amino-acid dehydrogenase